MLYCEFCYSVLPFTFFGGACCGTCAGILANEDEDSFRLAYDSQPGRPMIALANFLGRAFYEATNPVPQYEDPGYP